jgi:hypothetical protein
MADWLFSDFLENPETYAEAERYWIAVWEKVLGNATLDHDWQMPWMENPLRDGNPIFTALSTFHHRGVRIIQEAPGDPDDIDLDWWLDYVGEKDSADVIHELVIACCPSRQNEVEVQRLLTAWVEKGEVTSSPTVPQAK